MFLKLITERLKVGLIEGSYWGYFPENCRIKKSEELYWTLNSQSCDFATTVANNKYAYCVSFNTCTL